MKEKWKSVKNILETKKTVNDSLNCSLDRMNFEEMEKEDAIYEEEEMDIDLIG